MTTYAGRWTKRGKWKLTQVSPIEIHPRVAECGRMVSVNAGIGLTQIAKGNRMMAEAGVNATFDPRTGNMIVEGGRREYLKALKARGLHNNEETCGGNSRAEERESFQSTAAG